MTMWAGKLTTKWLECVGTVLGVGDQTMPWGQAPSLGNPKRYFVDPTNGNDNWNGLSWAKPFKTFEKAIDLARFAAGTTSIDYDDKSQRAFIFLAPGHYNEDSDHASQYLFSGYNISIIGCGPAVPGKDYGVSFNYDLETSSTAVILISGSGDELYGVHISCDAAIPALYIYNGDNHLVHNVVIECDGTTCTYGIYAPNMKGSRIEDCIIENALTAGIYVPGGADCYAINGGIKRNQIYSAGASCNGIKMAGSGDLVDRGFWIKDNLVQLTGVTTPIGIKCDTGSKVMVANNYVSVPTGETAISHAGGEQYQIGNHTAAGTTNTDPDPAAG